MKKHYFSFFVLVSVFFFLSVPSFSSGIQEVKKLIKEKDYDSAEKGAKALLTDKETKDINAVKYLLMTIYEKRKKFNDGIVVGEEMIKDEKIKDDKNIDKYYNQLSKLYDKSKKQLKAIQVLKDFIGKYPENKKIPAFYYNIGRFYEKMKQIEEATETYNTIISKYPDSKDSEKAQKRLDKLSGKNQKEPKEKIKKPSNKVKTDKKSKEKSSSQKGTEEEEED